MPEGGTPRVPSVTFVVTRGFLRGLGPLNPRVPWENELEARVGIEPTMQLLQSRALPLGDPALRESPANKGNEWFGRKSGFGKTPRTRPPPRLRPIRRRAPTMWTNRWHQPVATPPPQHSPRPFQAPVLAPRLSDVPAFTESGRFEIHGFAGSSDPFSSRMSTSVSSFSLMRLNTFGCHPIGSASSWANDKPRPHR